MTLGQCGQNPVVRYVTFSECLIPMLRHLGHEVDNRSVTVGEDLDAYDLIVTGLISPFSVAAKYIYPVLDILERYWLSEKKPVLTLIDDWMMHQISQNSKSARNGMYRLIRPAIFARRPGYSWAITEQGQRSIFRVLDRVTETGWPPAVIPMFGYGNASVYKSLVLAERFWPLDPTSYMPRYLFVPVASSERVRTWVLAAVQDHRAYVEKLRPSWPVELIGGGMTTRRGSLVPVTDVVGSYVRSWGVMSPPYRKLFGAGWWRERVVHAAMTRAVLLGDPRETAQLGEPYAHTAREIEAMSTSELAVLAEEQAEALRAGVWQPSVLHDAASDMLSATIASYQQLQSA